MSITIHNARFSDFAVGRMGPSGSGQKDPCRPKKGSGASGGSGSGGSGGSKNVKDKCVSPALPAQCPSPAQNLQGPVYAKGNAQQSYPAKGNAQQLPAFPAKGPLPATIPQTPPANPAPAQGQNIPKPAAVDRFYN